MNIVETRRDRKDFRLTRRHTLGGLTTALAFMAAPSGPASAPSISRAAQEDYYCFLWCEFHRMSEELGVRQHDEALLYRRGGYDRISQAPRLQEDSRAAAVLRAVKFEGVAA